MTDLTQKQILSILFAGGEPVEIVRIAQAIGADPTTVEKYIPRLRDALTEAGMPFELFRMEDKLQLCTSAQFAPVIRAALEIRRSIPLSQAAMEVLAIIAYNQPVTRAFVEQVRGVDSSCVVNSLIEKALIEEAGRMELPGRPISYKTTANFLRCFGLESLEKLPTIPTGDEEIGELPEDLMEEPAEFDDLDEGNFE